MDLSGLDHDDRARLRLVLFIDNERPSCVENADQLIGVVRMGSSRSNWPRVEQPPRSEREPSDQAESLALIRRPAATASTFLREWIRPRESWRLRTDVEPSSSHSARGLWSSSEPSSSCAVSS